MGFVICDKKVFDSYIKLQKNLEEINEIVRRWFEEKIPEQWEKPPMYFLQTESEQEAVEFGEKHYKEFVIAKIVYNLYTGEIDFTEDLLLVTHEKDADINGWLFRVLIKKGDEEK